MDFPLVWAKVDLNAIAHNVREVRRITSPAAGLMAVVKANAYGHGILKVSQAAVQNGADALGVARINEGIIIRKAGLDLPVLVFGYTPFEYVPKLVEFDLTQTVFSLKTAQKLSDAGTAIGKKIKVHLKIDTGMGRLGLLTDFGLSASAESVRENYLNALAATEAIACLKGLELEGIYTHFASADSSDKLYTKQQFEIFMDFLNRLDQKNLDIPVKHAANSAAIIDLPETHLNMVRSGILIYGLYPSDYVNKSRVKLKPAMELKSKVVHLKNVPAGFRVSYGMTYVTKKPTIIATVPIGYSDGLNRLLSSSGYMLVGGAKAPIAGRVCMDMTMLDIGHIQGVKIEDEVVIFGRQGALSITADEIADTINTINYEIITAVPERMPRFY